MLRTLDELHDYTIGATDGVIGHVKDLFVDDEAWVVRYLVVNTGGWFFGGKVLITPMAIGEPDWAGRLLPVSITQEQVKHSPDIDTDKPVTRQHEMEYSGYYGYPYYWGDGIHPGLAAAYGELQSPRVREEEAQKAEEARNVQSDPHLRSCKAITGYVIHASDGVIGHVHGMLIDDETWAVRYLVVNTSNWWGGHQMLVAPEWIESVTWANRTVSVKLTRQAVKDAPAFESTGTLTREDEARLHAHYGRSGYWTAGEKPVTEVSPV